MVSGPHALRRICFAASLALTLAGVACEPACAQGKLEVSYTISVARLPIGKATWSADIGVSEYSTFVIGETSGALRIISSGRGSLAARGAVRDSRLVPASFASNIVDEDETVQVSMVVVAGAAKEQVVSSPPPKPDVVPLTEAHRLGVVDPLTAMLFPVAGSGDPLAAEACERRLPIFDGRRRFDLRLMFKRMDTVKADKGYQGPVVVCAATFHALAGHRAGSTLVEYLSDGRDIELWLAPIAGTRLLAPFRISIASMLGNMLVLATEFETLAHVRTPNARPQ